MVLLCLTQIDIPTNIHNLNYKQNMNFLYKNEYLQESLDYSRQ